MTSTMTLKPSPFHAGEQQVQQRLGVRDKIEAFAQRVVRNHMPDQHREFYGMLPYLLIGSVDADGQPWASMVTGQPGFITSPDPNTLEIAANPLVWDPLNTTLKPGTDVGILRIELDTRRRNRLTGKIASVGPGGFAVTIDQAFGNCPQYIQTRAVEHVPATESDQSERPFSRLDRFDARTRALIENADTLFIATHYADGHSDSSQGADVSHRGGKPGFVRVEDDRTFVFPDFSGNNHFNTVGNIVLNPKAGFLFADFESRDLVYMTGTAEIIWNGEQLQAFSGAERLIRFRAAEVIGVETSLPLRFTFGEYSPSLDYTGSWTQAAATLVAAKESNAYTTCEVFDVQRESDAVSSFYLRRADGKALAGYEPGQFLPIRLTIPGEESPVTRTYTVSDAANADHYRLSIKREGGDALVSTFFHHHVEPGFHLEAMAPRGKFVLDQSSDRPVVLLSAGVGITPMIAMTNFIINEGRRTRSFRPTYFIHGTKNGRTHAFGDHIRRLAAAHESLTVHIAYSSPDDDDRLGESHDSEGRVDVALIKHLLPLDDYGFYLCGPPAFMQGLYDGLADLGVGENRIHYESFGPATVLNRDVTPSQSAAKGEPSPEPVGVCFSDSNVDVEWSPDRGTLLDLAEAAGLNSEFSCRSGVCGTCATRLTCGEIDYIEEPIAPHGDDEVLICCSTPRSRAV